MGEYEVDDGQGRHTLAEVEHAAYRPDLPDCARCVNGTKCNCAVYVVPFLSGDAGPIACGCMGFLSCPECPRRRSGLIASNFY